MNDYGKKPYWQFLGVENANKILAVDENGYLKFITGSGSSGGIQGITDYSGNELEPDAQGVVKLPAYIDAEDLSTALADYSLLNETVCAIKFGESSNDVMVKLASDKSTWVPITTKHIYRHNIYIRENNNGQIYNYLVVVENNRENEYISELDVLRAIADEAGGYGAIPNLSNVYYLHPIIEFDDGGFGQDAISTAVYIDGGPNNPIMYWNDLNATSNTFEAAGVLTIVKDVVVKKW